MVARKSVGCLLYAGDDSGDGEVGGVNHGAERHAEFLRGGHRRSVPVIRHVEVRDKADEALRFLCLHIQFGGIVPGERNLDVHVGGCDGKYDVGGFQILFRLQRNSLGDGAEAVGDDGNFQVPGWYAQEAEVALAVGEECAGRGEGIAGKGDAGSGDSVAVGVNDGSADGAGALWCRCCAGYIRQGCVLSCGGDR